MEFHAGLGLDTDRLRFHAHGEDELAHYAKSAFDIEYEFPFGWKEFEGIHNRTDFDLSRHEEFSGKRMQYIEPGGGKRFIPYVIETSMGVDRTMLVVLADAYREEEVEGDERLRHAETGISAFYDESGSIGRRYRRQDEAGTPWCITVDGETTEEDTVTIRDRDTLEQVRVGLDRVVPWIRERLEG